MVIENIRASDCIALIKIVYELRRVCQCEGTFECFLLPTTNVAMLLSKNISKNSFYTRMASVETVITRNAICQDTAN